MRLRYLRVDWKALLLIAHRGENGNGRCGELVENSGAVKVRVEWDENTKEGTWTVVLPAGYVVFSHWFLESSKNGSVYYHVHKVNRDNVVGYYRVSRSGNWANRVASWLDVTVVVRGIRRERASALGPEKARKLIVEAIPDIDKDAQPKLKRYADRLKELTTIPRGRKAAVSQKGRVRDTPPSR